MNINRLFWGGGGAGGALENDSDISREYATVVMLMAGHHEFNWNADITVLTFWNHFKIEINFQ